MSKIAHILPIVKKNEPSIRKCITQGKSSFLDEKMILI